MNIAYGSGSLYSNQSLATGDTLNVFGGSGGGGVYASTLKANPGYTGYGATVANMEIGGAGTTINLLGGLGGGGSGTTGLGGDGTGATGSNITLNNGAVLNLYGGGGGGGGSGAKGGDGFGASATTVMVNAGATMNLYGGVNGTNGTSGQGGLGTGASASGVTVHGGAVTVDGTRTKAGGSTTPSNAPGITNVAIDGGSLTVRGVGATAAVSQLNAVNGNVTLTLDATTAWSSGVGVDLGAIQLASDRTLTTSFANGALYAVTSLEVAGKNTAIAGSGLDLSGKTISFVLDDSLLNTNTLLTGPVTVTGSTLFLSGSAQGLMQGDSLTLIDGATGAVNAASFGDQLVGRRTLNVSQSGTTILATVTQLQSFLDAQNSLFNPLGLNNINLYNGAG